VKKGKVPVGQEESTGDCIGGNGLKFNLMFFGKRRKFFRIISLIFTCCVLGTAVAQGNEKKLAENPYVDPKGFFQILPPRDCQVQDFPKDLRGKVKFKCTSGTMLQVIVQGSPFENLDELLEDTKRAATRLKAKYGGSFNFSETSFAEIPAMSFLMEIPKLNLKQEQIQFLLLGNHFTLVYGSPLNVFEKFHPLAIASLETLEPTPKYLSTQETEYHIVSSKLRTARNLIKLGQIDYALIVINEGLQRDPKNERLLKMKASIVEK